MSTISTIAQAQPAPYTVKQQNAYAVRALGPAGESYGHCNAMAVVAFLEPT